MVIVHRCQLGQNWVGNWADNVGELKTFLILGRDSLKIHLIAAPPWVYLSIRILVDLPSLPRQSLHRPFHHNSRSGVGILHPYQGMASTVFPSSIDRHLLQNGKSSRHRPLLCALRRRYGFLHRSIVLTWSRRDTSHHMFGRKARWHGNMSFGFLRLPGPACSGLGWLAILMVWIKVVSWRIEASCLCVDVWIWICGIVGNGFDD